MSIESQQLRKSIEAKYSQLEKLNIKMSGMKKELFQLEDDYKLLYLNRVQAYLKENRLTQAWLARRLGISRQAVHQWFTREKPPSESMLRKLRMMVY